MRPEKINLALPIAGEYNISYEIPEKNLLWEVSQYGNNSLHQ